jgi:luciferase family oxidoreductase group 1
MRFPLSVLDLAPIARGDTAGEAIAASVALAQRAEETGFDRVWYAEHHNMPSIASSATSVLIAHVGAHTERIRLGAGGVMLPNHSPLTIAEQFGTLDAMYPGRIDLGLGRAPGSDQNTMYALRRDERSAERFPQDVLELQAYLAGETRVPGVDAVPGKGSRVPLYVLGSSMFGATLAAALGLPYAFASHFAPQLLEPAVAAYRQEFRPSAQLDRRPVRPRPGPHRRGGRPAPGIGRRAARRADDDLQRRRHPGRRPGLPRGLRQDRRRRRADRGVPVPDDRGAAALGHPDRRGHVSLSSSA